MGSVLDFIDCPNCGKEAMSDYYYKTGEEYTNCNNCGYHYSATIKNRDKKMSELTEQDWEVKEVKQPYGAFRYQMAGEISTTCGTLATEQDANNFRVEMKLEYQDHVNFACITRVVDGKEMVEQVVEPVNNKL
tara:strand:+ start:83 stop:481 length:399 start_codon:yes stop_codon:yes gene_type:complete